MGLKQDQRAMLQLLLERGQSYEDIASLLGVEREDARARAHAALTELAGQDPDSEVGLSDYLLGQADPIGRADVARHLQQDEHALEVATELATKLAALAPEAELPTLPERRGQKTPFLPGAEGAEPGSAEARAGMPSLSMTGRQAKVAGLIAGAVAILVAVVLVVSGAFEGDSGATATADGGSTDSSAASDGDELLTTVALEPQGGNNGSGEATFGVAAGEQPYLDLTVEGLRPAPNGRTYVLWLLVDGERGHPLTPLEIPESGALDQRFPIDGSTVVIAAATREVDVALAENSELAQVIQRAVDRGDAVIRFTGQSVLRGQVPLADQVAPGEGQGGGGGSANGGGGSTNGGDDGGSGGDPGGSNGSGPGGSGGGGSGGDS